MIERVTHKRFVSTNSIMDAIIRPGTTRSKRGPYRRHSDEFKRAAVARTLVDGASVSWIVRKLKVNSTQLFNSRKRFVAEGPLSNDADGQLLPGRMINAGTVDTSKQMAGRNRTYARPSPTAVGGRG